MSDVHTATPFLGKTFGVTVSQLTKKFGKTTVLHGVDLEIKAGEIFCIMGPSGSGKTVILKHIAGLERPTSGEVKIGEFDAADPSMNSSAEDVASCGRPAAARCERSTARSNRPFDATTTRSVRSRRTGLAGLRNDPHAQFPPAPRALRQTISPRSSSPSRSCRMPMTSAESER